ncbi:MAG: antibiotic biosynthesis monooxygenase [Ilumatobacter sp.]|uniref:antibiotic biosynthesis monooxygenase family protein n=1 Tax=Ilumatobacter sp. TaxID=1967498 RepID=UPI003299C282
MAGLASTPEPPYHAVIFTSTTTDRTDGYAEAAARMIELAGDVPGFLGVDSARGGDGVGITVSYWESEDAIATWRADAEHTVVRETGRTRWYQEYELRVARVERAYGFTRVRPRPG